MPIKRGNTNGRINPELPQSKYPGVCWCPKGNGGWRGFASDILNRTSCGRVRKVLTKTFPKEQEAECAAALAELRARLDAEFWTEMEVRAAADPSTRGVPRGPEDAVDAEPGKVYWRPNKDNLPYRALSVPNKHAVSGRTWTRACAECECKAYPIKLGGGVSLHCMAHVPLADRCPHSDGSTLRIRCVICRGKDAEAAGKVAQKLAQFCSRCQSIEIAPKRKISNGGNGLCPSCETTLREEAHEAGAEGLAPDKGKSWEDHCLDMLIPLVPHGIESRDSMTHMIGTLLSTKRKVRKVRVGDGVAAQDCDTTKQRRPDLLYVLRHPQTGRIVACINVEIDEHSHSDTKYLVECELGRCDDIFAAMSVHAQREGFLDDRQGHGHPDALHPVVYVLKLNPNACNVTSKTMTLERRIQTLADRINAIFETPREELVDAVVRGEADVPRVELFYYHTAQGARHLEAYREAHAKGSLCFAGNVVS